MEIELIKKNILKKILNQKMMIITDFIKNEYYIGEIESVVDGNHVMVKNGSILEKVNIFNLRSISRRY